jgi:hypothetical protein
MPTLTVELNSKDDADMVLPLIAQKIQEGYTSGYSPDWKLEE